MRVCACVRVCVFVFSLLAVFFRFLSKRVLCACRLAIVTLKPKKFFELRISEVHNLGTVFVKEDCTRRKAVQKSSLFMRFVAVWRVVRLQRVIFSVEKLSRSECRISTWRHVPIPAASVSFRGRGVGTHSTGSHYDSIDALSPRPDLGVFRIRPGLLGPTFPHLPNGVTKHRN